MKGTAPGTGRALEQRIERDVPPLVAALPMVEVRLVREVADHDPAEPGRQLQLARALKLRQVAVGFEERLLYQVRGVEPGPQRWPDQRSGQRVQVLAIPLQEAAPRDSSPARACSSKRSGSRSSIDLPAVVRWPSHRAQESSTINGSMIRHAEDFCKRLDRVVPGSDIRRFTTGGSSAAGIRTIRSVVPVVAGDFAELGVARSGAERSSVLAGMAPAGAWVNAGAARNTRLHELTTPPFP